MKYAIFGDNCSDECAGGDIECGVIDRDVVGADLDVFGVREFGGFTFFDWDEVAGGEGGVEG